MMLLHGRRESLACCMVTWMCCAVSSQFSQPKTDSAKDTKAYEVPNP